MDRRRCPPSAKVGFGRARVLCEWLSPCKRTFETTCSSVAGDVIRRSSGRHFGRSPGVQPLSRPSRHFGPW
jgi:hypothetical protein